ncbi:hypothetical protein HDV04_004481 [Boothiomyces sp. JEL0838]|nr:hypothetical protein HDV04_004481 [Boothiomyces sp. JEL0838]
MKMKNDVAMFCFKNVNLLVFPNKQFFTRNTSPVYQLQTLLDYYSLAKDYEPDQNLVDQSQSSDIPVDLAENELHSTKGDRLFASEARDKETLKRKWSEIIDMAHELRKKVGNQLDPVNDINEIAQKIIELKSVKIGKDSIENTFYSVF